MNRLLRQQLDEATAANQSLAAELTAVKRQYKDRQMEWTREEHVCIISLLTVDSTVTSRAVLSNLYQH